MTGPAGDDGRDAIIPSETDGRDDRGRAAPDRPADPDSLDAALAIPMPPEPPGFRLIAPGSILTKPSDVTAETSGLLLYADPRRAIAADVLVGGTGEATASAWHRLAEGWLGVARRGRDRILVAEEAMLGDAPALGALAEARGIPLDALDLPDAPARAGASVDAVLGDIALRHLPDPATSLTELQALGTGGGPVITDGMLGILAQMIARARSFEAAVRDAAAKSREIERLETKLRDLSDRLGTLKEAGEKAAREHEKVSTNLVKANRQIKALRQKRRSLESRLNRVLTSKSYRITAPIRRLRRLLGKGA